MDDLLEERRRTSDLRFVLQRQNPPRLEFSTERTNQEISEDVVKSPRMAAVVSKISRAFGKPEDEVVKEAQEILREMAHARSMTWVRASGFFLSKIMKCVFEHVNVNSEQVEKIRPLLTKYPVIFMPSHRSYMDFLLLSFVLFQYSLPCPVICAAQDFLNMGFFANVIRHCGGFFIRRSFSSDKLYWNIFSEFVQTHILNGDFPLEFFIEGTRSRTGKSLLPKLGMLSTAMECVIRGQIPDVVLVPIAVSFDRVMEESLYAHELLGIPKPKESTSGLFKARSVLSENYGSIHVIFGDPIFSKDALTNFGIDRSVYNLMPRTNEPLSPPEMKACSRLGLEVLLHQQSLFVVSPFAIISALLLQSPTKGCTVTYVRQKLAEISAFATQLGLRVGDGGGDASSTPSSADDVVDRHLRLHAHSVQVDAGGRLRPKIVESGAESSIFDSRLLAQASRLVELSIYRNQMLHFFVDASLVVRILSSASGGIDVDTLAVKHEKLRRLLNPDFLFAPEHSANMLSSAVDALVANSIVVASESSPAYLTLDVDHPLTEFLDHLLLPFLQTYYLAFHYLREVSLLAPLRDPKSNAKLCQEKILNLMTDRGLAQFDMLSLDTLANASTTLLLNGIARKSKEPSRVNCLEIVDITSLEEAEVFLREFVSPEYVVSELDLHAVVPKAKL